MSGTTNGHVEAGVGPTVRRLAEMGARLFGVGNGRVKRAAAPAPDPAASVVTDGVTALGAVLSPSQVKTFLDCSARWWFK